MSDPMSFTIRPATVADIPAIQAVGKAAWRDTYTGLVHDGYLDDGFARSWASPDFEQALASPHARLLVAETADGVVGMVQLGWSDEGIASLWRLYLLRDVRGVGLGTRLWQAVIADLPASLRTFRTSVVRGNPALRFYERLGFAVTHVADSEYAGYRVPLIYLERPAHGPSDAPPTDQALVEADYGVSELNYNAMMEPAYHSALATLGLPTGSCGLDLGCGPGGLLPLLARQVGPNGRIIGVDVSMPHLAMARRLSAEHGITAQVRLEWVDLARPLPFTDASFDWVWSADVLWPDGIEPRAVVREATRVLRPGGRLAIWFVAERRGIFLPGEPALEHALHAARSGGHGPPQPATDHHEQALGWLRDAGLTELRISAHQALARPPIAGAVRDYLEGYMLKELRRVLRAEAPDLDDATWARWQRISDPESPEYCLDQPDYYCLQIGLLAHGRKPLEVQP